MKTFIAFSAVLGFLSVALGAFAAHGLKGRLEPEMLDAFKTGAQYQMYHALALAGVAILLKFYPDARLLTLSGWFFIAGTILFSGSLYLMAVTGVKALGAVTPFGGISYLAGWALLLIAALKF